MTYFKVHATLCLSNWGGIAIMVNDCGDAIRYQWYDNKPTNVWQKIKYANDDGRPYVRIKNRRFYLDEFMRVNR